jgi:membrane-bound acyltransferase YfiQ involved in biofilm formation
MKSAPSKGKFSHVRGFFSFLGNLVSTYLGMILTIGFLVPFILGAIKIHNYDQITSFIEVFILVSATLSLLSFTYIMALTDLHEKVKESMIKSGELFFMSTVQFIVGLFLLFLLDYLTHSFLNISNIHFNLDGAGLVSIIIFLLQIFILLELIFAVSKFFKGVMGVYISFRAKNLRESVFFPLSWRGKDG